MMRRYLSTGLLVTIAVAVAIAAITTIRALWFAQSNVAVLIAHGMGEIEGSSITNSKEAFEFNYARGKRIFEVDIMLTADHVPVLIHDGMEQAYGFSKNISAMTALEFAHMKINFRYSSLNIDDVLELLEAYPDIIVITDTKSDIVSTMYAIVTKARMRNIALLDRIIPQIYQPQDLSALERMYNFKRLIFTLYRTSLSDEAVLQFVKQNPQIVAVAMPETRFSDIFAGQLHALHVHAFVHTLNERSAIEAFIQRGATGIYTDHFEEQLHYPGNPLPGLFIFGWETLLYGQ